MRRLIVLLIGLVLSLQAALPVAAVDHGNGSNGSNGNLDMYSATVDPATAAEIVRKGYDVAETRNEADGRVTIVLILSPKERAQLRKDGVQTAAVRDAKGRTSRERALEQAASGFNVWRSYDEPGGIRDELYDVAKKYAGFVKLEVIGHTIQGREIIALKVTQGAKGIKDGARPSVLYMSNQHAREWISVEVNRRLLHWFLDQRKLENPEIVSPPQDDRAVVHPVGQPRWLPVHVRPRASVAQEPARQQRRRPDQRSAMASTRTATTTSTGTTTTRARRPRVERHIPRTGRRFRARDPGRRRVDRRGSSPSCSSTTTRSARSSSIRRAGRSGRRTPTTRSTPLLPGPMPIRQFRASTRASARTSST